MIHSFRNKTLEAFWDGGRAKGIDPKSAARLKRLLSALHAATTPRDMDVVEVPFHRAGTRYEVKIGAHWYLVFGWVGVGATGVDIEDRG